MRRRSRRHTVRALLAARGGPVRAVRAKPTPTAAPMQSRPLPFSLKEARMLDISSGALEETTCDKAEEARVVSDSQDKAKSYTYQKAIFQL